MALAPTHPRSLRSTQPAAEPAAKGREGDASQQSKPRQTLSILTMRGLTDQNSFDPRKFMTTPLDLLGSLRDDYAEYEAPRDGRISIKVPLFSDAVTTALGAMKEHSDKGNGHRVSDGAAIACCVSHGIAAILSHRVATDNIQFTSDLNLLRDCDLMAHEIVASQCRDFPVSLGTMGGSRVRSVWLPIQFGNNILGLAQNMGAKPGHLLMVAVMSALSTQDFLSGQRRQALALTVAEYMKGYSYRARFGLAAIKVAEEIGSETDSWG